MPAWLALLLLMLIPILIINPNTRDDAWFRSLRRPSWLRLYLWVPQLWLLIDLGIYAAALRTWMLSASPLLTIAVALLVILVETCNWFLCRTRRLKASAILMLAIWGYGLSVSVAVGLIAPPLVLPLLPFLVWMPFETLAVWQMPSINRLH
ncbi:MAG: tryptophan-rich sensory protein [Cyanobacteriota bacterium]|nr:tryptophan-rich sensory protein [Cyanobacteriota bacterium]